jgi:uncharacterized membrane protein YfcA
MSIDAILLFALLALIAEVAGTISGFGSSVFFVPIATYFFDFHSVLGITALFHIFSNISKIYFFRQGVNWKIVLYLGIPAVLFVGLGAFLSKLISSEILETALAFFLIIFSLLFLLLRNFSIQPTNVNSIIGGTVSGFMAGLLGTGGAIRGMTLAAFDLKKGAFIATSALIDFGVDLSRGVVYVSNGFVHWHDMKYVLILFFISVIGTYIGKRVLVHVSEKLFKNIVLFVIFGIGLVTIVNQFFF